LCGIARNKFGLSPKQFYSLSPKQFNFAIKDYQNEKDLERDLAFCSASPEVINKAKTANKMLEFPWDAPPKKPKIPTNKEWESWE